jgi:two-component system, LytTR family, response regulator
MHAESPPTSPLRVLVVDDEPHSRNRLLRLLAAQRDVAVVGSVGSAAEATEIVAAVTPDLLFVDVRMPGEDGLAFTRAIRERGIEPFVVFVTAYSEHAVAAFDLEAVDFLLKPFDEARFERALSRARADIVRSRDAAPDPMEPTAASGESRPPFPDRVLVSEAGRVVIVPVADIEFLQAAGKLVKVFAQGRCHLVREPLQDVAARLNANQFVRVHRSTVVNIDSIQEMHPLFHGDYDLILKRGTRIKMSRRYRTRLMRFIAGQFPA